METTIIVLQNEIMNIKWVFFLFGIGLSFPFLAQTQGDLALAKTIFNDASFNSYDSNKDSLTQFQKEKSKSLSFYKNYISSQDQSVCTFYPSCSVYSSLALKKHGLMEGVLITCDRLNRCHNFCNEKYPVHQKSGLQFDPLDPEVEHDH